MKLVMSRKLHTVNPPSNADIVSVLNSGFGNTSRVMNDSEVDEYVSTQASRGFVCYVFDHTGTFHSQTTVVRAQAA